MARGNYGGSTTDESSLLMIAQALVNAPDSQTVLKITDEFSVRIGYKPFCYLVRLLARGFTPEEAVEWVKAGWDSDGSPFGKGGKQAAKPPVVIEEPADPDAEYFASLIE